GQAEDQMSPHRVGKTIKWRWTVGQHDFRHELAHVGIVMSKSFGVPLLRVPKQSRRTALTAPIHGGNCETAAAQVRDRLEVLFDEFRPALKEADSAEAPFGGRIPARKPDGEAVARGEITRNGSVRYRISCDPNQAG